MPTTKRKSASARAEERMIAEQIAKAKYFTASLILGPHDRRKADNLPSYEAAQEAAAELNKASRFGRKAIIYAVSSLGSFPCDDEMIVLARSL